MESVIFLLVCCSVSVQFKSTKNKILPEQTWLVIETNAFEAQALQTSYLDNFKDASSDKIQFKTYNFSH